MNYPVFKLMSWVEEAEHQFGRLINLRSIFRQIASWGTPGDIVEFGSYRGLSAIWLARFRDEFGLDEKRIVCLDSFQGLPETTQAWAKGQFADTSQAEMESNLDRYLTTRQRDNIHLVAGWFSDPEVVSRYRQLVENVCIAHIDCDLKSSAADALSMAAEQILRSQTFVCFDDWGVSEEEIPRAWDDFLATYQPDSFVEVSRTNLTKYFLVRGAG